MKTIKKLLYLLQLEDYQTNRYSSWLKKFSIEQLVERKNKLRLTGRAFFILLIATPMSVILGKEKSVGLSNFIVTPLFNLLESILVFWAKIKLICYPNLIKIAITGSYGKTTFKEMLSCVLQAKYSVLKTPKNINTRLGIARTILSQLNKSHQIFVVEAGAYQAGEIKSICQLLQPSFGIVTSIGWMHLERFGTFKKIKKTKLEVVDFIKNKQKLFLPKKDHELIDFKNTIARIGELLGISKTTAQERLSEFKQIEHRLTTKKIGEKITVLDDTYNSNPLGFTKALNELKKYENHQKIVVTPGMIELGSMQDVLNRKMAEKIASVADIFVIVGQTNKLALDIKNKHLRTLYLDQGENLDSKLSAYLRPPTVILLENELPDHYF